jgi:seryl-tRNA synthetase
MDPKSPFLAQLVEHGYLIPMGVDGLYGRSGAFEQIVESFNDLVTRHGGGDGAEVLRFPPGLGRKHFEESEYLKSFPHLAGTVHCFDGDDRAHHAMLADLESGADWTLGQKATDVVMTPAACYPLYPMTASRGPLPPEGRLYDVFSYCFRHEPSVDPTRMQLFRMREYVRIGSPEQVIRFRETWLERGPTLMESLGLTVKLDVASDPFFGRVGKFMANSQREQRLKFELLIPVVSEERLTACLSFNYHETHFGDIWNIRTATGDGAQTACVGVGMERITLALLKRHGFDLDKWPASVRDTLGF